MILRTRGNFCGTFVRPTKSTGNLGKVPFDSHSRFDGICVVLVKKVPRNIFNIILWYKGTFVRMFFVVFLIRYDLLYCIKKVPRSLLHPQFCDKMLRVKR